MPGPTPPIQIDVGRLLVDPQDTHQRQDADAALTALTQLTASVLAPAVCARAGERGVPGSSAPEVATVR